MYLINKSLLHAIALILTPIIISFSVEGRSISEQLQFVQILPDKVQTLTDEEKLEKLNELEKLQNKKDISPKERAYILKAKSTLYYNLNQLDNALNATIKERDIATKHQFKRLEADANNNIGMYAFLKGENLSALHSYQLSLVYYQTIDEPISQANSYQNIAQTYERMGIFEKALKYLQKAEVIYQKFGTEKDKINIKDSKAIIYTTLKRYKVAIDILNESIQQRLKLPEDEDIATNYLNLGVVYYYDGEYEKSAQSLNKALDYALKNNNEYDLSYIYVNFAHLHNLMSDSNNAIIYAEKAKSISFAQKNFYIYASSLQQLSKAYFQIAKYHKALALIMESIEIATKFKYHAQSNDNLALQSLIYAALNLPNKAIKSQKEYEKSHGKLISKTFNSKISLLESELLQQKQNKLKKVEHIEKLKVDRSNIKYNLITIIVIILIIAIFFISYRIYTQYTSKYRALV